MRVTRHLAAALLCAAFAAGAVLAEEGQAREHHREPAQQQNEND